MGRGGSDWPAQIIVNLCPIAFGGGPHLQIGFPCGFIALLLLALFTRLPLLFLHTYHHPLATYGRIPVSSSQITQSRLPSVHPSIHSNTSKRQATVIALPSVLHANAFAEPIAPLPDAVVLPALLRDVPRPPLRPSVAEVPRPVSPVLAELRLRVAPMHAHAHKYRRGAERRLLSESSVQQQQCDDV